MMQSLARVVWCDFMSLFVLHSQVVEMGKAELIVNPRITAIGPVSPVLHIL